MKALALPSLFVAIVLLLPACSTRSDMQRLEETMVAEFRETQHRQDSLAAEVRALGGALLDSLASRERTSLGLRGDLERRLEEMGRELSRLQALVGQNQRTLLRLEERLSAGTGTEGFAAEGAGAEGPAVAGAGAEEEAAARGGEDGEPAVVAGTPDRPRRLYEASLQQFRRGALETARVGLQDFLDRFPDHELAPDALFYVAETWAGTGNPERALEAYARVLELHPGSRRAPTALYKSGLLELERGNVEDARAFFSRVVQGYPDSDEAALARDRLARTGG